MNNNSCLINIKSKLKILTGSEKSRQLCAGAGDLKGERSRLFCVFDDLKKIFQYIFVIIYFRKYLKKYKRIARKIMENKGKYDIL